MKKSAAAIIVFILLLSESTIFLARSQPTQCTLDVFSAPGSSGSPGPPVGSHSYDSGSSVTCTVVSPITKDGVTYTCTGWSGTGSAPSSGTGTTATFTITQNSSITWIWTAQNNFPVVDVTIASLATIACLVAVAIRIRTYNLASRSAGKSR